MSSVQGIQGHNSVMEETKEQASTMLEQDYVVRTSVVPEIHCVIEKIPESFATDSAKLNSRHLTLTSPVKVVNDSDEKSGVSLETKIIKIETVETTTMVSVENVTEYAKSAKAVTFSIPQTAVPQTTSIIETVEQVSGKKKKEAPEDIEENCSMTLKKSKLFLPNHDDSTIDQETTSDIIANELDNDSKHEHVKTSSVEVQRLKTVDLERSIQVVQTTEFSSVKINISPSANATRHSENINSESIITTMKAPKLEMPLLNDLDSKKTTEVTEESVPKGQLETAAKPTEIMQAENAVSKEIVSFEPQNSTQSELIYSTRTNMMLQTISEGKETEPEENMGNQKVYVEKPATKENFSQETSTDAISSFGLATITEEKVEKDNKEEENQDNNSEDTSDSGSTSSSCLEDALVPSIDQEVNAMPDNDSLSKDHVLLTKQNDEKSDNVIMIGEENNNVVEKFLENLKENVVESTSVYSRNQSRTPEVITVSVTEVTHELVYNTDESSETLDEHETSEKLSLSDDNDAVDRTPLKELPVDKRPIIQEKSESEIISESYIYSKGEDKQEPVHCSKIITLEDTSTEKAEYRLPDLVNDTNFKTVEKRQHTLDIAQHENRDTLEHENKDTPSFPKTSKAAEKQKCAKQEITVTVEINSSYNETTESKECTTYVALDNQAADATEQTCATETEKSAQTTIKKEDTAKMTDGSGNEAEFIDSFDKSKHEDEVEMRNEGNEGSTHKDEDIMKTLERESKTELLMVKDTKKEQLKSIENLFAKDTWENIDIHLHDKSEKTNEIQISNQNDSQERSVSEIRDHEIKTIDRTKYVIQETEIRKTKSVRRQLDLAEQEKTGSRQSLKSEYYGQNALDSDCGLSLLNSLIR